jgi:hypothetical protein
MTAKLAERLPVWRKTIQDADNDPKLLEAFDRGAAAIANRANVDYKTVRGGLGTFVEAVEKKYRVPVGTQWYGFVGNAMNTPVSDGERVYVVYGQGQVAAYDLDGRLVWAKHFAEWERAYAGKRGTCNLSPLLCDNVLILKSPNVTTWRALDARTGALLWERKDTPRFQTKFPSARVVRLRTAQGEPVNAVVYPDALQIRRSEDDRVLGEFPADTPRPEHGYQFVVNRDLVLLVVPGQRPGIKNKSAVIYRLRATAKDRVDLEEVYALPVNKLGWGFLTTTPEHILLADDKKARSLRLQPFGGPLLQATETAIPHGETAIVAGKTVFSVLDADGGNNAWWRGPRPDGVGQGGQGRMTDRKAMVRIVTADISNPAAVRILGDRNLLQEAGPAADIYVEQYLNGMDPFLFAGTYHGSASFFGGLMGSMTPSGNRLFIQSATHLRCIGDPAVKYDWNPQSRPAHITKALKAKE